MCGVEAGARGIERTTRGFAVQLIAFNSISGTFVSSLHSSVHQSVIFIRYGSDNTHSLPVTSEAWRLRLFIRILPSPMFRSSQALRTWGVIHELVSYRSRDSRAVRQVRQSERLDACALRGSRHAKAGGLLRWMDRVQSPRLKGQAGIRGTSHLRAMLGEPA